MGLSGEKSLLGWAFLTAFMAGFVETIGYFITMLAHDILIVPAAQPEVGMVGRQDTEVTVYDDEAVIHRFHEVLLGFPQCPFLGMQQLIGSPQFLFACRHLLICHLQCLLAVMHL